MTALDWIKFLPGWFAAVAASWTLIDKTNSKRSPSATARERESESKTIPHPSLGPIDVHAQVPFTENRAQPLVVTTARPGTESPGKLELLSVIGHQQLMP